MATALKGKEEPQRKRHPLEDSWDKVAEAIIELEKVWNKHQETYLTHRGKAVQLLPPGYQKHLSMNFNLSKFSVALPRMIDYIRAIGGTEALKAKEAKDGA